MNLLRHSTFACSIGLLSLLAAPAVMAGRISVDFSAGSSFDPPIYAFGSGLAMTDDAGACSTGTLANALAPSVSCSLDLSGAGFAEVALNFGMDIGGTTYNSLFINEDGFVTFGSAAPPSLTATDFSSLQSQLGATPFITPAYADMQSGGSASFFNLAASGPGVLIQRGFGTQDPGLLGSDLPADPTGALGITWLSQFGSNQFVSQLILVELANSGFAARFNYGVAFDNNGNPLDNPAIGAFAGYSLGSLSGSWGEATFATNSLVAFDSDGGNGGTPVPEPSTLLLFGMGVVGLLALRRGRPISRIALQG
jgi:hypothetical protein